MIGGRIARFSAFVAILCASALTVACQKPINAPNTGFLDSADGANWQSYGRTYGQQHYSPLDQINTQTVSRLGLAWSLDFPPGNTVTQPIAVDGVIYVATGYSVVRAIDAVSGKILWTYDPGTYRTAGPKMRAGWGSRGIGYWNGKVYTVTLDGRAIGIDAKTGKPVWETQIFEGKDNDASAYVTGAPFLFDGKVIIGNAADFGPVRGRVTALDAQSGKLLWRFFTVPGDPSKGFEDDAQKMAAATWHGDWWKFGGNGSPWNAFAYDPETRSVFVGTGNGSPYSHKTRSQGKGDNLFLASIVALDVNTGKYKWHYQANPAENWDFTATMDIELAEIQFNGERRKVLMTAPKNGFYYIIDRKTGELLSAKNFVPVNWASHIDLKTGRPVENPKARALDKPFDVTPTANGGHNWQPMSYSPKTGLTYIPINTLYAAYSENGQKEPPSARDVAYWQGMNIDPKKQPAGDPNTGLSALIAWDPVAQKEVWRVNGPRLLAVAAMATGGNVVFHGSIDSTFSAYSAIDGKKLWSFPTQAPALSPVITYAVNGKQYVTMLTGITSQGAYGQMLLRYKLDYRSMERRMLTFALDEKATLPPKVEADLSKPADPDYRPDPASTQRGALLFNWRCGLCHGASAISGGFAPDLRRSTIPQSKEAFASIVTGGALLSNGMPQFDGVLNEAQLDDIRHYIRAQAHNPATEKETNSPSVAY